MSGKNLTHQNRFGKYTVCGQNYHNKLSAVMAAVKDGHWIHWDFNDSIFEKYNWSQEPRESLSTLYGNRARQLREQYAHIAIEFSGGADSWNLLYHFCRQGLHVDTIIHRYIQSTVKSPKDLSHANSYAEGLYQAWPSFQALLHINPTMKWTTWDIEHAMMQCWASPKHDFSLHNNFMPQSVIYMPDMGQHCPGKVPNLESSAMIFGIDKPVVEFHDGKFYLVFYDHQVICRNVMERQLLGHSIQDIFFYWDPDCMDMMAKQGHIIMNWVRQHPTLIKNHCTIDQLLVNQLIYPEYQPIWQSKKSTGHFAISNQRWFIDGNHLQAKNWHNTMHNLTSILENTLNGTTYEKYLQRDGDTDFKSLVNCPSRAYYLGDL